MSRTVLITGATGTVSTALLKALKGADVNLRALVRDEPKADGLRQQGVEVVIGDLDDARSLPPAFKGVQDTWLLTPNGPRAPEHNMNAVWAARQAGVERIVRLSVVGAAHDAPNRSGRLHALSDRETERCGMRWTVLRPHWFMQNLLNEAGDIAATSTFMLNMASARIGMIDVRDIAECAARVLLDDPDRHHGQTYTLTGPRSLTFDEVADQLKLALDQPVTYLPVSDDTKRKTLLGYGVPTWIVDMLEEYAQAYASGWGDLTTDTVADLLGRPRATSSTSSATTPQRSPRPTTAETDRAPTADSSAAPPPSPQVAGPHSVNVRFCRRPGASALGSEISWWRCLLAFPPLDTSVRMPPLVALVLLASGGGDQRTETKIGSPATDLHRLRRAGLRPRRPALTPVRGRRPPTPRGVGGLFA
ncbi:SDR family oxidoreductase [Micromonospora zhanjiangensis]